MKKFYSFVAVLMLSVILLTTICSCGENENSGNESVAESVTDAEVKVEEKPSEDNYTLIATDLYYRNISNNDIKKAVKEETNLADNILNRYVVTVYVDESTGNYKCSVRPISNYLQEKLNDALSKCNYNEAKDILDEIIEEQDRNFVDIETTTK